VFEPPIAQIAQKRISICAICAIGRSTIGIEVLGCDFAALRPLRETPRFAIASELDLVAWAAYAFSANAVGFTTELSGGAVLPIPREIAAQLPESGKARVIVLTGQDTDEAEWHAGAYEQFPRDDSTEDAIYESLR
jgi:hypothetical protein